MSLKDGAAFQEIMGCFVIVQTSQTVLTCLHRKATAHTVCTDGVHVCDRIYCAQGHEKQNKMVFNEALEKMRKDTTKGQDTGSMFSCWSNCDSLQ